VALLTNDFIGVQRSNGTHYKTTPSAILALLTGASVKALYEGNTNTNVFTDSEKTKLAGLEGTKFKGTFLSLSALNTAHPSPSAGEYADVDSGSGADVQRYIADVNDSKWVAQSGTVSGETAASIKTKYESNSNTNAFTDQNQSDLAANTSARHAAVTTAGSASTNPIVVSGQELSFDIRNLPDA
jgi:hypothetical protein